MINLKIVLPGEVPVKKNTVGQLWFRVDKKTGRKIPLATPITYYRPNYQKWAKAVVPILRRWKEDNAHLYNFPLKGSYITSFVMFRKHRGTVDLSNLYEAPQDLLAGHAGNFLDTFRSRDGIREKVKFPHESYKILDDDNCNIICGHGASTVIYVPNNPRLEIFISEFKLEQTAFLLKNLHPGLELSNYVPESGQTSMFADNSLNDLLKGL
jgi:hypothetical protein